MFLGGEYPAGGWKSTVALRPAPVPLRATLGMEPEFTTKLKIAISRCLSADMDAKPRRSFCAALAMRRAHYFPGQ